MLCPEDGAVLGLLLCPALAVPGSHVGQQSPKQRPSSFKVYDPIQGIFVP